MEPIGRVLVVRGLLAFVVVLGCGSLARLEAHGDEYEPVSLVLHEHDCIVVGGNYDASAGDEGGYWFWGLDGEGERRWEERIPDRTASLVGLAPAGEGTYLALLSRYGKDRGYVPLIRRIDVRGQLGDVIPLASRGIASVIRASTNGTFLIGGASRNGSRKTDKSEGTKDPGSDWDAWLLEVKADGTVVGEWWEDRGQDECLYALNPSGKDSVYCAASSGKTDKFGGGPSRAWVFRHDRQKGIVQETFIDDGRFLGGGAFLSLNADELVIACSLPQPKGGAASSEGLFSFPALVTGLSLSLEKNWAMNLPHNQAMSTPVLATGPTGGCCVALAQGGAPALHHIEHAGSPVSTITGEQWSFEPLATINDLVVNENNAYILGGVVDFMSEDDDETHVFLVKADLATSSVTWQKRY